MCDGLKSMGVVVEPPKGSIYVWVPVPEGHTSESFTTFLLDEADIVVAPGNGYGPSGEGFVRFSLTLADERLEEGVERLRRRHPLSPRRPEDCTRRGPSGSGPSSSVPSSATTRWTKRSGRSTSSMPWPTPRGPTPSTVSCSGANSPDPATYLGKGKVKEIVDMATALDADMLIFDDELTPAQGRNLEEMAGVNPLAEQRSEDHRSHRIDPRHLRPARALRRGEAAGRTGAAQLPAPATSWLG